MSTPRKLYYAHPGQLEEGRMLYLDSKRMFSDMVRVRVEIVRPKRRAKKGGAR